MRDQFHTARRLVLWVSFAAALFLCHSPAPRAIAGGAAAPEDALRPVKIWEQSGVEVFAIQDRAGQMDISLFSGPASPQERAAYFKNGKAEAGANAFLIRAAGKNILVDAGFGGEAPGVSRLTEQLALLDVTPADVDAVLLSHAHTDHIGGLVRDGRRVFPGARLVISAMEYDYWSGAAERPQKDGQSAPSPNAELFGRVTAAYGEDVYKFFGGPLNEALELESLAIMALPAFGHTPGHTVFSLGAHAPRLLILGDLVHAVDLQFALPQECAKYDQDRRAAAFVRESVLSLAAETQAVVAGMHIPFPGAGGVFREGKGFRFAPLRE